MRGLMGSGCRTSTFYQWLEFFRAVGLVNVTSPFRKIFPPTHEEPTASKQPEKAEEATTTEASAIGQHNMDSESQAKKVNPESDELGKDDWEAVEKPSETSPERAAELTEEGEKIEAVELAGSDGEQVEKPVYEKIEKAEAGADTERKGNSLLKDW